MLIINSIVKKKTKPGVYLAVLRDNDDSDAIIAVVTGFTVADHKNGVIYLTKNDGVCSSSLHYFENNYIILHEVNTIEVTA